MSSIKSESFPCCGNQLWHLHHGVRRIWHLLHVKCMSSTTELLHLFYRKAKVKQNTAHITNRFLADRTLELKIVVEPAVRMDLT